MNETVKRKHYRATEYYRTLVPTRGVTVAKRLNRGFLIMQLSDIGTRFSPDIFFDMHDPDYLTHYDPTESFNRGRGKRRKHTEE